MSEINIALAGNPNAGKTTIFNNLTGSNQRVGNYPGVTVEKRIGQATYNSYTFNIVDLPGTYSLSATAEDELVARNYIIIEQPQIIVNVIDASNLYRNLYLTLQLLELEMPLILNLNMLDAAQKQGISIDINKLSQQLDIPLICSIGSKSVGTQDLLKAFVTSPPINKLKINYGSDVEQAIDELSGYIKELELPKNISMRWLALKLLENDISLPDVYTDLIIPDTFQEKVDTLRANLASVLQEDINLYISEKKYEFINIILQECTTTTTTQLTLSDKVDQILTHKIWGLPIFFCFMWLLFNMVFTLGSYPQALMEDAISLFSNYILQILPPGELSDLIVNGIIGGVGGVVVFLPNILLLFLGISILEGTGYMARAAFLMDKVMQMVGLHGKSFIPLLIGFGCTVPAIMGTRTLENKHDRLVTMLVAPFMSCSARLPVYTLLISAFFSSNWAGSILFLIYFVGILFAIVIAKIFRSTLFPGQTAPFVMEMPPYRIPTLKSILLQMLERALLYLKKAGTIILASSIIIWFLTSNPQDITYSQDYTTQLSTIEQLITANPDNPNITLLQEKQMQLEQAMNSEKIMHSYAGQIGKFIQPVLAPLGFNWQIGVALLSAFSAKEVLVSTLATIYSVGNIDGDGLHALAATLQNDSTLSPLIALSLMIFVLLYTPCMATIAIIYRETAGWYWPIFTAVYSLLLAWLASFIIYQGGLLLGF